MTDSLDKDIFGEPEPPATRRSRRQQRPTRQGPPRARRWLTLLLALALVGGMGWAAFTFVKPLVSKMTGAGGGDMDFPGPGSGEVKITVAEGQTGEDIATTLRDSGVTKTRTAYLDAATADPQAAAKIQPGTYALKKGMKGVDAFEVISNPANATNPNVSVPEGLWASEIFERMSKVTGLKVSDYENAAKDTAAIGLPAQANGNIEGWLSPATYQFPDKSTAVQQLAMMVKRTKDELDKAGVAPDNYVKILTVASIVEGEAGVADRGKVARVVENRLDNPTGPTVGLLQMDSTRNYALKKRGNLTKADVDSVANNPYNTYTQKGLPPGPINNPGAKAIDAAAKPTPGPWYYFVTVNFDTGETLFAETLAEQDGNVRQLRAWCDANKPKCEGK